MTNSDVDRLQSTDTNGAFGEVGVRVDLDLELATIKTTTSQLVSRRSRLDGEAGDVPALKLANGHEGEEADRNKSPAANSSLEESFEPPLWDDLLM